MKTRQYLSLLLALVCMIFFCNVGYACDENLDVSNRILETENLLIFEDDGNETYATMEVNDSLVTCSYNKDSNQYFLYLDDNSFELNVDVCDGGYAYVTFANDTKYNSAYDNEVVGQLAATVLSSPYWTPALISAAKIVIAKVIAATTTAVATYYAADLIATTVNGVRQGRITVSKARTKAGKDAITRVKTLPLNRGTYYYLAELKNGTVVIGTQISYSAALRRLKKGYDVFCSNATGAQKLATAASPLKICKWDKPHIAACGYYPHYHPYGIKYFKNRNRMPHVWYPYL